MNKKLPPPATVTVSCSNQSDAERAQEIADNLVKSEELLARWTKEAMSFGIPPIVGRYENEPARPTMAIDSAAREELRQWFIGADFGADASVGGFVRTWSDKDGRTYVEGFNEHWVWADSRGEAIRMNSERWAAHIGLAPLLNRRLTWLAMTARIMCDGAAYKPQEHIFGAPRDNNDEFASIIEPAWKGLSLREIDEKLLSRAPTITFSARQPGKSWAREMWRQAIERAKRK